MYMKFLQRVSSEFSNISRIMPRKSSAATPRFSISSARSFFFVSSRCPDQKPIFRREAPLITTGLSLPQFAKGIDEEITYRVRGVGDFFPWDWIPTVRQFQKLRKVAVHL